MVLIGIAQEKTPVWRSWKAKGQEHSAHPHMEWGRQMAFVNHFFLSVGSGVRRGVLEDQRLCAVAGVDLAQRAHLGAATVRTGRHRLHRPGQWVSRLCGRSVTGSDLVR